MEDLNVTIRTLGASVSGSVKPPVAATPGLKSAGPDSKVVNAPTNTAHSLGVRGASSQNISAEEVKEAVNNLNSQLANSARSIRFQIDDTTNKIEVFVVDEETGEVVRRIPPEASIRLMANGELSGLFSIQG